MYLIIIKIQMLKFLSKILDSNEEFSPNSPSNLKIYQNEIQIKIIKKN